MSCKNLYVHGTTWHGKADNCTVLIKITLPLKRLLTRLVLGHPWVLVQVYDIKVLPYALKFSWDESFAIFTEDHLPIV